MANYQVPGVYVTQNTSALTTVSPTALKVAIVADQPTLGVQTDVFTVPVATSGITLGQLTVPMVNLSSSGTYASYSGFSVTWVSGTTSVTGTYGVNFNINTASGISYLTTSSISSSNVSALPSGNVNIQYGHYWGAYGTYYNQNSVVSAIGTAISGTSIINPAVLASQLAFQNGASTVTIVPVARLATSNSGAATTSDWVNTFNVSTSGSSQIFLSNTPTDVVVPLNGLNNSTTGQLTTAVASGTVASGIANYFTVQQNAGHYQRGFLGVDATSTFITVTGIQTLASGFNSSRISLAFPAVLNYNPGLNTSNGLSNVTFNIPGYYLAAAVAGTFVGQQPDVSTPITNKQVYGFNDIPNQISLNDAATSYLPYGIMVVRKKSDGYFWVLQGLTTNISTWLTQEISINAIGDRLAQLVRSDLVNSYLVGGPLTKNTSAAVIATVQATLTNALSKGLIQSYQNLSLALNPATPTTVSITFQYAPTYPINYIQASLSLNTQTGQVVYGNAQSNFVVY